MNNKVFLTSCIGLDHDIVLLDQFCQHYIDLGISPENFLLVLNTSSEDATYKLNESFKILDKHKISPKDIWLSRYESEEKWARVHKVLTQYVQANDWVVHPDADEFHEITSKNYPEFLNSLPENVNAGQGLTVDRLAADCKVPSESSITQNVFEEFPVMTNITNLIGTDGVKLAFYRGNLRANNGSGQIHEMCRDHVFYLHGSKENLAKTNIAKKYLKDPPGGWDGKMTLMTKTKDEPVKIHFKITEPESFSLLNNEKEDILKEIGLIVHHFKWHGNVIEKLEERIETYIQLERAQVCQSIKVYNHYVKNKKFVIKGL